MNLFDVVRPECIQVGVQSPSKDAVLQEIAALAKKSPLLANVDEKTIFDGLQGREKLGSTGFGDGVAIPHCRLDEVDEFVVGLVVIKDGIDFDALDKKHTHIVVFIIGPSANANDHVHLLSEISQALHVPGAYNEILAETHPEAVRESFLRHVLDELEEDEKVPHVLMHTIVQKDELFEDILQVFCAMSTASVSVVGGQDTTDYLNKLPMFSGFFSEKEKGFHKIIVAVVQKQLANETVRQIDKLSGGLRTQQGVMVVVQDVFYTAGQLNT